MSARQAVRAGQSALPPWIDLLRALDAVWKAKAARERIADTSDAPKWQDVDAADLLDAAALLLAREAAS